MKKLLSLLIVLSIIICLFRPAIQCSAETETETNKQEGKNESIDAAASAIDLTSKSAILMEGTTGKILFEKEKDYKVEPASITKIMTMILIFEALEKGKIKLTDEVSVSEHAASMGGSQVFLEPNEKQTVDTMLKCISIASANDACVAMAEYVAGSEEEFVSRMNKRAKQLGMNNTNFVNCCGLDVANHITTAYDVALMSRELIMKHPEIKNYCTVWMDKITHVTRKGSSEFGLTNTNKLVRFYDGITGLKTGSTSKAKFCLSATATRNGTNLIAVVMSAPAPKDRFAEAATLLDYGFANCSVYKDNYSNLKIKEVKVTGGVDETICGKPKDIFSYVCTSNEETSGIKRSVEMKKEIKAPLKKGEVIGTITYTMNKKKIGTMPIVASKGIRKAKYKDSFVQVLKKYFVIH